MSMKRSFSDTVRLTLICLGVSVCFATSPGCKKQTPVAQTPTPTAPPATKPATQKSPAVKETPPPKPPFLYIDAVRANLPAYPATQPLALPVDLPQAAHLVLRDPIYLDSRLNLWITRPEAPPTQETLGKPNAEAEYVVPDRVLFVHWSADDRDRVNPRIVTPRPGGDGFDYISPTGRRPLPGRREWIWSAARPFAERFFVPTPTGVSVFRVADDRGEITEAYQDLLADAPATPTTKPASDVFDPQLLFDGNGFLAWLPPDSKNAGGRTSARFVDDKWTSLGAAQGWPERVMHLIPLVGGSVMQFVPTGEGNVKLNVAALEAQPIDRKAIEKLVIELAATSQAARDKAFAELTRYGPSVRPVFKEMIEDQPPEAQSRLRQLLAGQVSPLLGPMSLLGDKLQCVTRQHDGGAVFYAEAGVTITDADGEKHDQAPAWLAIRPGRAVQLLPGAMVADLTPDKVQIVAVESHDDDWIITSDARGPRRFLGNEFVKLLRKDEAAYTQLLGVDRRGRWLFRKPGDDSETLLLDPTLPDATPRLPVWNYANADEVGWDKEGWPAVKQSGIRSRLQEFGWSGLEEKDEIITAVEPPKDPPRPSTAPTTSTSQPADVNDSASPILTTPDGTKYFDGVETLRVVPKAGREINWSLSAIATGKAPAHLVRTEDGRLFLFNQPGRVLRFKPTPGQAEPFVLEATFTRNVPTVDTPIRIWLDPAGRIIVAYESKLAILFPQGSMPPKIRQLMVDPGDEDDMP